MTPFLASSSGIIQSIKAMPLGLAASLLGAGRLTKEDQIKFGVGFVLKAKVGDKVSQNDVICEIYHDEPISDDVFQKLNDAIIISNHEVEPVVLIHEICE
jgi:pyrimidine-nucleoside phosphorylase